MALTSTAGAWSPRRRLSAAYYVLLGAVALAITLSQLDQFVAEASAHPELWLMTGLALLSGTLAFIETPPPGRTAMIVCPTICFTFAILLCWGLGPAIVAQIISVVLVAWRLRTSAREAIEAVGQYTLAFAAASVVLWIGQPDPFERDGPTNLVADAISIVAAVTAWLAAFGLLAFVAARIQGSGPRSRQATGAVANQILFKAALLLLSPVLAVAAHINFLFVPLVIIPLLAVQRMARLSTERDRAARMDPLTKLANRSGLRTGFEDLIVTCPEHRSRPGDPRPTLLLLDLDRFKDVNDALGHDVGDRLLVAVAERVSAVKPAKATVARLGGDEFAILTSTRSPHEATWLADKVVQALAEPVSLDGLRIDVTASVGIARHVDDRYDFADLMRHADVAMYDAKQRGASIAAYAERPDQYGPERLGLLTDFRDALEADDGDQIAMHYQPQVSLMTGEVEGVEALLRWNHPVHGPICTQELLAIVERSALMQLLTRRVIDDVVAQVADWTALGITLRASLNVSARDLYSDDIVAHLAAELSRHEVRPQQIQIEITESALLADPSRAQATVGRLAALGVSVSLDDFGTGYSSLQHLRKLSIAEIKIDRTFVAGMADNRDDSAIVRSTVEMARSLGIRTVAEGVETEYTRRLLAETGCTLAQGWLTARPMPGNEISAWLARYQTPAPAPAKPAARST